MPDSHPEPPPPYRAADVAVVAAGPPGAAGLTTRLAAEVVVHELRLRRSELRIEAQVLVRGGALDLDGEPTLPSAPGSEPAPFVVICAGPADAVGDDLDRFADGGAVVELLTLGTPDADPLELSGRLLTDAQRDRHLDTLRLAHKVPGDRPYLVRVLQDAPAGTDIAVDAFAFRLGGSVHNPAEGDTPHDLLAAISGAAAIVSDDPRVLTVAAALGRPALVVEPERLRVLGYRSMASATFVRHPDDLLAMSGLPAAPSPDAQRNRQVAADDRLDQIADRLTGPASAPSAADLVAVLMERVRVLEATNAALRARIHAFRRPHPRSNHEGDQVATERLAVLQGHLAESESDRRRLQEELDRLYATKTMKLVGPVRQVYGRLRSGGG